MTLVVDAGRADRRMPAVTPAPESAVDLACHVGDAAADADADAPADAGSGHPAISPEALCWVARRLDWERRLDRLRDNRGAGRSPLAPPAATGAR